MNLLYIVLITLLMPSILQAAGPIDRKALVERHNITFTKPSPADIPQVGNGEIAFGIDVTGLQTLYGNTLSQWGWHTTAIPVENPVEAFRMTEVNVHGRIATYPVDSNGQEELYWWLRKNPHRLNLGKLSFMLDGKQVQAKQLTEVSQKLDLWRGVITSSYKLDGVPVMVVTTCHPKLDMLAAEVRSPLVKDKRLSIQIAFPYGNEAKRGDGADWKASEKHTTGLTVTGRTAVFKRKLDEDRYEMFMGWDKKASLRETAKHVYTLQPSSGSESFSFVCQFTPKSAGKPKTDFKQTLTVSTAHWQKFWKTGGAIDLSGSKDKRWKELERRVVLSQYLLAVNEAGSTPPQESGLHNFALPRA